MPTSARRRTSSKALAKSSLSVSDTRGGGGCDLGRAPTAASVQIHPGATSPNGGGRRGGGVNTGFGTTGLCFGIAFGAAMIINPFRGHTLRGVEVGSAFNGAFARVGLNARACGTMFAAGFALAILSLAWQQTLHIPT